MTWPRPAPRHILAFALGGALLLLPLFIMSYDPNSRLERLRTPLCKSGLQIAATDQDGRGALQSPDSGVKMNATVDGHDVHVQFEIFTKPPGQDWSLRWTLDAPNGHEIYYLPSTPTGFAAYVRALDPTGGLCPADSGVLAAR